MLYTLHIYCRSIFYYIIFLEFQVILSSRLNVKKQALRIMGGRNASIGEFPYVMSLATQGLHDNIEEFTDFCTCSLLKPTWSITAGHCIESALISLNQDPKLKIVVRYNSFSLKDVSDVLSFVSHSSYAVNLFIGQNDIGLLKTQQILMATFAKISSVDYSTLYGQKVLSLGYGLTEGPNDNFDDALKVKKPLQVLEAIMVRCDERSKFKPTFCLVGPCGQWSALCPGDSGGPVVHPSGIVGINTATDLRNCHSKTAMDPIYKLFTKAGIITPVSLSVDWIAKVIE